MSKREVWIDNIKVVTCIIVVLVHFFQSMVKSNIMPQNYVYEWFNQTAYNFHIVALFFICSGYLYQRYSKVYNIENWTNNVFKKALNLGIPYFVFSCITFGLKGIFKNSVNTSNKGFIETLFLNPIAPYWYLYVLFFIFLVTPTFKSKQKMVIAFVIALILKILNITGVGQYVPYGISGILDNEIWFVSGMFMSMFEWKKNMKIQASLIGVLFLVASIYVYAFNISFIGMGFLFGILECVSIISIIYILSNENKQCKLFEILSKYTLPIFLMHTIFASGFRSILGKLGVHNMIIHVILGLIVSFTAPIITAWIMEKTTFLNIFLYPSRCINTIKLNSNMNSVIIK